MHMAEYGSRPIFTTVAPHNSNITSLPLFSLGSNSSVIERKILPNLGRMELVFRSILVGLIKLSLCPSAPPHPHYKPKKTKQSFTTTLQEVKEGRKNTTNKQTNEHDFILDQQIFIFFVRIKDQIKAY
jgi:hypothetical protein